MNRIVKDICLRCNKFLFFSQHLHNGIFLIPYYRYTFILVDLKICSRPSTAKVSHVYTLFPFIEFTPLIASSNILNLIEILKLLNSSWIIQILYLIHAHHFLKKSKIISKRLLFISFHWYMTAESMTNRN